MGSSWFSETSLGGPRSDTPANRGRGFILFGTD
jgi:hypothetical protein